MSTYTELERNEFGVCGVLTLSLEEIKEQENMMIKQNIVSTPVVEMGRREKLARELREYNSQHENTFLDSLKQTFCDHNWYAFKDEADYIQTRKYFSSFTDHNGLIYNQYSIPNVCLKCKKEINFITDIFE